MRSFCARFRLYVLIAAHSAKKFMVVVTRVSCIPLSEPCPAVFSCYHRTKSYRTYVTIQSSYPATFLRFFSLKSAFDCSPFQPSSSTRSPVRASSRHPGMLTHQSTGPRGPITWIEWVQTHEVSEAIERSVFGPERTIQVGRP